ncbi:MAG: sigma-54 dependent transcriptional regulator [Magnetococcus sp. DMHC-6]
MGRSLHILVIDDEPAIRQIVVTTLKKNDYSVESIGSGAEALVRLENGDVDVAICDINMPGMDGIEVVRQAREMKIETVFLMMTAFASIETAVKAMRSGAYDYLIKPLRKEDLLLRLEQIGNMIGLQDQNRALRNLVQAGERRRCRLVSPGMMEVDRLIRKVAPTEYTVLISGESGTGKGILARQMHEKSRRSGALFIPVNCGSIPENLLESEFFGHTKGAFTGADRAKKGLFLEADNGTLFLDEIGELPLHLQVKLLHVLEEKQIRPVGSEQFRKVDVRIVAATNRDLQHMVTEGTFREDLFFRLNIFSIHIPPLRSRKEDIPLLVQFFLDRNRDRGDDQNIYLDSDAEAALKSYTWPGNVRELENVIERSLILAENGVISLEDLPKHVAAAFTINESNAEGELPPGSGGSYEVTGGKLRDQLRDFEIRVIQETIERANGDRKLAARQLGIGLSSLYRKLESAEVPNMFC